MTLYKRRERFHGLSLSMGRFFSRLGLSPNQWTILALIPALIAFYFLVNESFLLAGLSFIIAAAVDVIDGGVAKVTGRVTKFGAYLDTIVDRYVEGIILFGLLFASLPGFSLPWIGFVPAHAWIFLCFLGAFMTTYAKASAKEAELIGPGKVLKGGLLERAERLLILFIGILLAALDPYYLTYVIVILAVLANISALQRIRIAYKSR